MKRHLLSGICSATLILATSIATYAQTVPFKPLYEEFTSSTCGPCAGANEIMDPVLDANEESHSAIKYQVDWPGIGDPYYNADTQTRVDYYGIDYAPHLKINASEFDPYEITQQVYDSYLGEMTSLEIEITDAEIGQDLVATVSVDLNALVEYPAGLKAHIAIVENRTVGNIMGNGEVEFFNVMMKMLPDAGGTTLPAMESGSTETLTFSHDMSTTFMEGPDDLSVIVFVQDDSDQEIIQSEHAEIAGEFQTYDLTFNVFDSNGNEVEGAEVFLQANGIEYSDGSGQITYSGVFDGTYTYTVEAAGLFPAEGTVTVQGADAEATIELGVPDYLFFEDFQSQEGIPTGWLGSFSGWDFIFWNDGEIIFFRQSATLDPLYLASPAFDITNAGTIFFSLGNSSGDPEVGFGTIETPTDESSYEQLTSYFPGEEYEDHDFDLSEFTGDTENVRFCWRHLISDFSFFSMTYVVITEGIVDDLSEERLKSAQVFPNPAADIIQIQMELIMHRVSIHDAQGRLVKSFDTDHSSYSVDVSDLSPGVYSVLIETEKGKVLKTIAVD